MPRVSSQFHQRLFCCSTMYAVAIFSLLIFRAVAVPATQEPVIQDDNTTLTDYDNDTTTSLTPSTIAPTVKSRPVKELSPLEEKIKILDCNMLMMPAESKLWESNQSRELLLPAKVSQN